MTPPPTDLPDIASPSTFAARAQAWVLWLNTFYTELAAIIGLTIPAGSAAAGTLTGDTLAANVTKSALYRIAAAGGTVDAITVTNTPPVTSLTNFLRCDVVSAGANTSATPTFAPDGLTAHTITTRGGGACVAGDIGPAGFVAQLEYNLANTRWELLNPQTASDAIGTQSSYTGTLTGCTTSPTGTVYYTKIGNIVVMSIPSISATSNTTGLSITGGPVGMRPASTQICPAMRIRDSGADSNGGIAIIGTDGVITISFANGNSFTGSGTKGVNQSNISYLTN